MTKNNSSTKASSNNKATSKASASSAKASTAKLRKTKVSSKSASKAQTAMEKFKMEAASEVGVNLKDGYNGNLTARQAGAIGGQMVKKMIKSYKNSLK